MPIKASVGISILFGLLSGGPCFGQGFVKDIRLNDRPSVYYSYNNGKIGTSFPGAAAEVSASDAERVRRVALFYLWLKRDPFFFSPHTELGGLGGAALRLKAEETRLLGVFQATERLYPVDFLLAYSSASALFDTFESSPSEKAAAALFGEIKKGVSAYSDSIDKLEAVVADRFASSGLDVLLTLGGESGTDKKTILSDLALIRANAAAAGSHLGALEKCLFSGSSACRPSWPEAFLRTSEPPGELPLEIIPPELLEFGNSPVRGPYSVYSRCWAGRKSNLLYYSEECLPAGYCLEWSVLASDVYFLKLSPYGSQKRFLDMGFKIIPQAATTDYACSDLGYKPALQTVGYFDAVYSSRPVTVPPGAVPGLAGAAGGIPAAEKMFFGEKIKSQRALERLGRAYWDAARALELSPGPEEEELLARANLIRLKTTGLGLVINRMVYHLANYVRRTLAVAHKNSPMAGGAVLYLSRSHYSLLFMPFSPSVWRIQQSPACFSPNAQGKGNYIGFREAAAAYGDDEVKRTLKFFKTEGWKELSR